MVQSAQYRYFIILLITLILPSVVKSQSSEKPTQSQGIIFIEGSWSEALRQAKLQNKCIFVDAYATWCMPCTVLKSITFQNKKAAEFYNGNFINLAMDMERGEGPALSDVWGIQSYPTMIIFDQDGNVVLGAIGYINARNLINFGKQALIKHAATIPN
jgi:thioredoxin 1